MKEELTTTMHEDFIGIEVPHDDLQVMAVYGAINRGVSKKEALQKYHISEKHYDDNIDRVLHS